MEEGAAATVVVVGEVMAVVVMIFGGSGEVETREKGFKRRIAVDEGGDVRGSIFDEGSKRKDEKREKEECDEV